MSYMSDHGARLLDNGFPILPIKPMSKIPGWFNAAGEWTGYVGWTKHCDRATSDFELKGWSDWPDTGIGIACGWIVAADLDIVQDHELVLKIDKLAREMLGDTPATRIGMWPKRLLVYRTDKPFAGIKKQPIEILGHGQQFVAEGIHPETGQPYYWIGDSLVDMHASDLPIVTEEQCRAFLEAAYDMIPPELRPNTIIGDKINGNTGDHQSSYYMLGTIEALEDAMRRIPNADVPYHDWVRIGMALKGGLGDRAEAMFHRWSALSKKHVAETTTRFFSSARPTEIGAGTIYYIARHVYGWVCPTHLTMNGLIAWEQNAHPAQRLIEVLPLVEVIGGETAGEVFDPETGEIIAGGRPIRSSR